MCGCGDGGFESTVAELEAVCDESRRAGSRAGYFAALYLSVTRTVAARAAAGAFDEPARMERFVTQFARRYLDAHAAWRTGQPAPVAWQAAFEQVGRWRPTVLQHVLAGMSAHINFDLALTAVSAAGTAEHLPALRGDFDAINEVLAAQVDGCQAAVCRVSPVLRLVDWAGGRRDELAASIALRLARTRAWQAAERIAALAEPDREAAVTELDRQVAALARPLFRPGGVVSLALLAVRLAERSSVSQGIDALAAVGADRRRS